MKIAIDLGTTFSVVAVLGRGVILHEPSAIAIRRDGERVLAWGSRARSMIGRAPDSIEIIRPIQEGVIAHFDGAREMLRHFLELAAEGRWIRRLEVVLSVPNGATPVELQALRQGVTAAGAHRVDLVKEPLAAALGAELPIHEARGNIVLDMGGGTTEATAISLNDIVHCRSLRQGGQAMDQAIEEHFRQARHFAIGETTAEALKIRYGSVYADEPDADFPIKGLDVRTGRPATMTANTAEIRETIEPIAAGSVEALRSCIEALPPELAGDLLGSGVALVGGVALLRGWRERLVNEFGLEVRVAPDPVLSVTRGLLRILEDRDRYRDLINNSSYPSALAG